MEWKQQNILISISSFAVFVYFVPIKYDSNCVRQELTEEQNQKNMFILSDAAVTFKMNECHSNRYDSWHHAKFERCHYNRFQETKA